MLKFTFTTNTTKLELAQVFLPSSNRHVAVIFLPEMNCVVASDNGMSLMEFAGGAMATKEVVRGGFVDGTPLNLIPAFVISDPDEATKCLLLGYRDISNDYEKDDNHVVTAHVLVNRRTLAVTMISENPLEPRNQYEYATIICHKTNDMYPSNYPMLIGCHINQLHHNPHLHLSGTYNKSTCRIECNARVNHNNQYFVLEDSMLKTNPFRYQLFTCSAKDKEPAYLFNAYQWHVINEDTADLPIFMSSHSTAL